MRRSALFSTLAGVAAAAVFTSVMRRRARRLDLQGLVAVVTGGGRGLGLAITRELLARGCRVAICGREGPLIERSVAALRAEGHDVFGMACDASAPDQVQRFVHSVIEHYGEIDLLVNNAGQCFVGPAAELSPADMDKALRNIFWVHYHPTAAVLPHMRSRLFGRIANITSFGGIVPLPHQAAYVAGKYAATGWSRSLTIELRKEGVLVSTITPPPLRDDAPMYVHFNGEVEGEFSWFTWALTSHLTSATPEKTARTVVDALAHGDRERAVTFMSWLLSRTYGLAPNLVSHVLTWIERGMPPTRAPGAFSSTMLGFQIAHESSDPTVQRLGRRAEADAAKYRPPTRVALQPVKG
jgi:NAD(P)-dependent dehydrogenase (short-subunit alcohol dehydrogenase family)